MEKQSKSLPPKRGQIKAQIFEGMAEAIAAAASKAGEALGLIRKNDDGGGGGGSVSSSPPPSSSYSSDDNQDGA